MPALPNMSRKEREELEQAGNEDYNPDMEDNQIDDEGEGGDNPNNNNNNGDDDADADGGQVPAAWTFLGFTAFVMWGPFAATTARLKTVLINGLKRSEVTSRSQMWKNLKRKRKWRGQLILLMNVDSPQINLSAYRMSKCKEID